MENEGEMFQYRFKKWTKKFWTLKSYTLFKVLISYTLFKNVDFLMRNEYVNAIIQNLWNIAIIVLINQEKQRPSYRTLRNTALYKVCIELSWSGFNSQCLFDVLQTSCNLLHILYHIVYTRCQGLNYWLSLESAEGQLKW